MFSNFGFGEIAVLALLGLLIFGPDKLPKAAADAFRLVRQLRSMATSTVNDFKADLGPDLSALDLRSMHPRTLLERALNDDEPGHPSARLDAEPSAAEPSVTFPDAADRRRAAGRPAAAQSPVVRTLRRRRVRVQD